MATNAFRVTPTGVGLASKLKLLLCGSLGSQFLLMSTVLVNTQLADSLPVSVRDKDSMNFEHMWLDDFDTVPRQDNDDEAMQADSPSVGGGPGHGSRRRPPVYSTASEDEDDTPRCPSSKLACTASLMGAVDCQTDGDCAGTGRKCCFNGCKRTCLVPVLPPPYIDWKRQPQTRLASGKSWLIQGSDEEREVEWCSTSYDYSDPTDAEPLLCPSGFTCHIEEPGDEENEVPNRGRCIRESNRDLANDKTVFKMAVTRTSGDGACEVSDKIYRHGDAIPYGKHSCKCEDGSVLCHVGKKLNLRGGRKTSSSPSSSPVAAATESRHR